jgi:arylsulfatase A-like enzyme
MGSAVPVRPNILVVVMDCMRAADFPGAAGDHPPTPFLAELMKESVTFRRAITPAPWTIPAHASLFSGLYPWNHGAHGKADLRVPESIHRVSESLAGVGYATFSLSANPLLEPTFNLTQGFDRAAWASWWESFIRVPRESPAPSYTGRDSAEAKRPATKRGGRMDRILHNRLQDAFRFSFVVDGVNRLAQTMRRPDPGLELAVASWIEPTLAGWIQQTPAGTPVFAFVNLVEAHEPYFRNPSVGRGIADWVRYAQCRQDNLGFLNGDWTEKPGRMDRLHELYRYQVQVIDRRLARLVDVFKASRRWDNTLLIVTSDHGQAFGEHGMLFHMIRPDEPLLRIPMIARFPSDKTPYVSDSWASLVDIEPTLMAAAGIPKRSEADGIPLQALRDLPRPGPVLAGCDGVVFDHNRSRISSPRMDALDHTMGVAYDGNWKVVVDATAGMVRAFDISTDTEESKDRWDPHDPALQRLEQAARSAATALTKIPHAEMSAEVEDRLRSWGYL